MTTAPARRAVAAPPAAPAVPARTAGSAALRVAPDPRPRAARAPFVLLLLTLLGGGLLALLVLNTVIAQDAFRLHDLTRQQATLADSESQLRQAVDTLDDPAALAAKAAALGMVVAADPDPSFVRPGDNHVLGAVPAGVFRGPRGTRVGGLLVAGSATAPAAGGAPVPAAAAPTAAPATVTSAAAPTPAPGAPATPAAPGAHPTAPAARATTAPGAPPTRVRPTTAPATRPTTAPATRPTTAPGAHPTAPAPRPTPPHRTTP